MERELDMKRLRARVLSKCMIFVIAFFSFMAVARAAEVSQGKCSSYNNETKTITIEEYNLNFSEKHPYGEPTGVLSSYNVKDAVIGITPEVGDILRIAYDVKGTERLALKVMNVSKQDLRKK